MKVRGSLVSLAVVFAVVGSAFPAVAVQAASVGGSPLAVGGLSGASTLAGPQDGPGAAPAAAEASGERVEDVSQRDAFTRVFANPDGTWTAEFTSSPARVRDADGGWHDIDLSLAAREGGLAPRWAATDVVFSDGGDQTFASLTEAGETVAWRWPSPLPVPVVEGATATYRGVVPGGDLVVTATADGFRHDIVLRRAPEGPVEFTMPVVTGEAVLSETTDGGLEVASAAGERLVWAPVPVMWDAETDPAGEPADVAEVEASVGETGSGMPALTLAPDAGFLADPDTVYPVTIDPTYSTGAANDGWIWDADVTAPAHPQDGELKVGTNDAGATKHQAYLHFDGVTAASSPVVGKEILGAEFRLRNFDANGCAGAPIRVRRITSSWHVVAGFPDSLRWNNQPSFGTSFDDYSPSHGAGPNCPVATAKWDVAFAVKQWASGADNHGLRVAAVDATQNNSWRRYRSDNYTDTTRLPKLVITYNNQPTTPTGLGLVRPCPNDDCTSGVSTSLTPTLSAKSTDPDGNSLTYQFEVAPAGSTTPVATGTVGPVAENTTVEWTVPAGKLVDDSSYRYRVGADDRQGDGGPGLDGSAYSGWVNFSTDSDLAPAAPTNLAVSPCTACAHPWVTPSLNPELSARVADSDSDSLDVIFEVRPVGGATFPQGEGSGTDLVAASDDGTHTFDTARFTIPSGRLLAGSTYEFRVGARDGTSTTWNDNNGAWFRFTVDRNTVASVGLAEPLVVWDHGPELSWSPYRDVSDDPEDDLVEYQIFRGCLDDTAAASGCTKISSAATFTAAKPDLELVGTAISDETSWSDESALSLGDYRYWVVARTVDDVGQNRDGVVASNPWNVALPAEGRVRRILTGDATTPDAILSSGQQATTYDQVLQVGTAHTEGSTNFGKQRAVVAFDLGQVGDRKVTSASFEVYQQGGGPSSATTPTQFNLHALTKHFVENQVTWTRAATGQNWAAPGGDFTTTPVLASVSTAGGLSARRLSFTGTELTSQVQTWAGNTAANHGMLLKAADESAGAVQQWLDLTPSESTETESNGVGKAPRLVVEHLIKTGAQTIEAPQVPQRLLPGSVEEIPVTVTNTTNQTWDTGMDMRLSYRWTVPGDTEGDRGFQADREVALGRALAPGESVTVDLTLRAPINSDTGANRPEWDLYLDLVYDNNGTDAWWSDDPAHAYSNGTVDADERKQGVCEMVAIGLLCPDRLVQSSPSSEIGLEESATFVGEETGAGAQVLTNLHTGNLVWSYDAFANPSVGPSMFLRVAYNSLDTVQTGAGFGWSVQPGTLSRLGSKLAHQGSETSKNQEVTLIDGDGTSHTWRQYPADGLFRRPPGVALDLTSTGTDASGTWLFTRPDGTRFAYLRSSDNSIDGRAMWVEDVSGQKLTFNYTNAADPDQLTSVTDTKARTVATLGYYDTGQLRYVRDISLRALRFSYDADGKLIKLEDGGNYTPSANGVNPGSYANPAQVKTFTFAYTPGPTSSNSRLIEITDPIGSATTSDPNDHDTTIDYWDTTESYHGTPVDSAVNGWVQSVTDRRGQTTVVDYRDGDASDGLALDVTVETEVDPGQEPELTHYVVDSFGRATEITDPNGHTSFLGWDSDHNVVALTEPNGAVSRWQYDRTTGYPLKIWDPEAVANDTDPTVLTYGPFGRTTALTSITTPLDRKTAFGYDTAGRLTSVTDPRGTLTPTNANDFVTKYAYNTDGTLQTVTDANGKITTYAYGTPQVGYPTRITPPTNTGPQETPIAPTDFVYDDRGNVKTVTQTGAGQTVQTSAIYDEFGRPTSITTSGAQGGTRTTTSDYDLNDNLLTTQAPNGAVTTSVYTVDDLLDVQTFPANTTTPTADRQVSYDYFLTGLVKAQTSPRGKVTDYDYDAVGQLKSETRHDGNTPVVTSYGYDVAGNVVSVVDPNLNAAGQGEKAIELVYDLNHRTVTSVDALGNAARTRYDLDGQVVAEIDQRGNPTTYTYTPNGLVETVTVEHTPLGETDALERTTTFGYDPVGNQTRVTRPSGRFEQVVYDANNRPVEQRSAFDTGDANQNYRNPAVTYLTYDGLSRLNQQSAPTWDPTQKKWTSYTYWPSGEINTATDPWNIQTKYEYNKLGQQTKRTLTPPGSTGTADERVMTWDYYPDGSLHTRDDNTPATTARQIDNNDHPGFAADDDDLWSTITPASPDGQINTNYRVHASAAAGSEGSSDTATWTLTLPQTGRYRVQVSCPANAQAQSGVGTLTTAATYTISVNGQNTSATLNQRANCPNQVWHTLTDQQVPGGKQLTVTLKTSADGAVVADAVRLISLNTGRAFTYTYDPDGNQTNIADDTADARVSDYTTSYDDLNRPTQVQELNVGGTVLRDTDYDYDLNGNITSVTATRNADPTTSGEDRANLATSRTTTYQSDVRNLVTKLTTNTPTQSARSWTYTYNPAGMLQTLTKPNGAGTANAGNVTRYTYYEDGQVRSQVERTPGGATVASHQLWYTPDGDRSKDVAKVDNAATDANAAAFLDQTVTYDYTPTRLLESVTKSARADEGPSEEYTYDAAGNILKQVMGKTATQPKVTTTNDYDRNRLVSSTINGTTRSYTYDPFGRLTRTAGGGETVDYTYDGFDRLVRQVTQDVAGTTAVDTAYDPLDRVTLQITDTGESIKRTRFGYLGLTEQVDTEEQHDDTSGAWKIVKDYAYGPDGNPVSLDSTPLSGTVKTRYYSYNPHGDIEALTNPADGTTTATYRYTAYGDTDDTGTTGEDKVTGDPQRDADVLNPYRYSAARYNAATGTYDMGFRNYDAGLNTYLTRDMYNGALDDMALGLDPWNTNRYTLTGGNPISFIDLDGHYAIDDDGNPIPPSETGGDYTTRHDRAVATAVEEIGQQAKDLGIDGEIRTEYRIPGSCKSSNCKKGYGKADIALIASETIYIWEVKATGQRMKTAIDEAARYASKINVPRKTGEVGWAIGGPYGVPEPPIPNKKYGLKDEIFAVGPGGILYASDPKKKLRPNEKTREDFDIVWDPLVKASNRAHANQVPENQVPETEYFVAPEEEPNIVTDCMFIPGPLPGEGHLECEDQSPVI